VASAERTPSKVCKAFHAATTLEMVTMPGEVASLPTPGLAATVREGRKLAHSVVSY